MPMAETAPLVSIIVVNYDGLAHVERVLDGVTRTDYWPIELLVVDNASGDSSATVYERHEQAQVIRSPANVGFGRACNLAAEQAVGDLLLFLNPDIDLRPDTVSALVRDLITTPNAAIACATMLNPGYSHDRQRRVEDVAAMAGAVMLVERAHFERLGGFDPWIFLYSEDTDLCYRTWLAGRRVLKDWDAVADHDVHGTGGGMRFSAEQIKNGLYVHIKLRGWPATVRFAARMTVKTVVRGLRMRDSAVLAAWTINFREMPSTLSKRRAIRASATAANRAQLERLGAEHAYWARRSWRVSVARALKRRLTAAR
jgi:GT2 family glycosyltransferase